MPRGVAPVVAEAGPTTTPQELDKTDDNAMRDPPLCLGNDDVLSHVMQATSHNDPSVWCLFGAADADQTPRSERSGEKCSIDNHTLWSQRDDVESVMRVAGEAWDYHDWNARVKGIGVHSLYIPNVKRDVVREYAWQDAACAILQACLPAKLCHVTVNLVRRSMPKTAGQFDATEFADFVGNELRNRVDKLLVDMVVVLLGRAQRNHPTPGTRAWNLGRAVYSKDQGLREDRVAFDASRRASQGAGGSGEENASGQENVPPRAPVPT